MEEATEEATPDYQPGNVKENVFAQQTQSGALAGYAAFDLKDSRETLIMQYRRELREHQGRAARLQELLSLLEANPDTCRILELLGRR